MEGIGDVAAIREEEVQITTTDSNSDDLNPTTTTTTDPWMLFLFALKGPVTKESLLKYRIAYKFLTC